MDISPEILRKLTYSAIGIVAVFILFHVFRGYAKRTQRRYNIRMSRYFATRRLLTVLSLLLGAAVLIIIWNVNLKNVWISATGILTLIAVAFFAVWSLLANILAGAIIYFTSPFRIEDEIEIVPDSVKGTVMAVNTFYTIIRDDEENYISIPNSMLFQKYIRRMKRPGETGR